MKIIIALGVVVVLALIVAAGAAGYIVEVNNQLVMLDQNANEKWANVQNVYQRRADLVPNLVETVKGYARHERETLTDVAKARASATAIQATPELSRAFRRRSRSYPVRSRGCSSCSRSIRS